MGKMGWGCGWITAAGFFALAGRAYPVDVQVSYGGAGRSAQVRVLHAPDREPLAAVRFEMRFREAAGVRSLAVAKPESGPWSQFLPRAALDGRAVSAFAMAPATGFGGDSAKRTLAVFDLTLAPQAAPATAADLVDTTLILEAYGPDGKPVPLQIRYTTGIGPARPRMTAPGLRARGLARTLSFNLGKAQRVRAWISDVRGRRVADVLDRKLPAGIQEVTWDGKGADGRVPARGTYLFHLEAGAFSYDRKLEVAP